MNLVSEVVNLARDIIRLNACSHQITGADIKSEKGTRIDAHSKLCVRCYSHAGSALSVVRSERPPPSVDRGAKVGANQFSV